MWGNFTYKWVPRPIALISAFEPLAAAALGGEVGPPIVGVPTLATDHLTYTQWELPLWDTLLAAQLPAGDIHPFPHPLCLPSAETPSHRLL